MMQLEKPISGALSKDEIKRRLPQKPEELVDALNDPIHIEVGRSRPGRTAVKICRKCHD